jgi:hypothetical protein
MGCNFGRCCEAMRKSWHHYKMLRKEGDRGWDIILRINRIQHYLGIPLTEFRDGPDLDWVKDQLNAEEEGSGVEQSSTDLELKYEEEHQDREDSFESEDPLYAQLRREEREDNVNMILGQLGVKPLDLSESEETDDDW